MEPKQPPAPSGSSTPAAAPFVPAAPSTPAARFAPYAPVAPALPLTPSAPAAPVDPTTPLCPAAPPVSPTRVEPSAPSVPPAPAVPTAHAASTQPAARRIQATRSALADPAAPGDVPEEIAGLQRRVEQWRRDRRGREAMPDTLWTLAARAARRFGVARVSRGARLDYYALKERVAALSRQERDGPATGPGFLELTLPMVVPQPECTLELEHARGGRMRVHLKGAGIPDLAALVRVFRGSEP